MGCCEHGSETSILMEDIEFPNQLIYCYFPRKIHFHEIKEKSVIDFIDLVTH
jgi:hypothetical protein